jgi:hypothetical protein
MRFSFLPKAGTPKELAEMAEQEATQAADEAQDAPADATQDTEQQEEFVFDKWMETQPENVRGGFDDHVKGLKTALESERTTRKTLERRLQTLSKEAEAGSELKAQLDALSSELSDASAKADFFKDAHQARVIDLDLAWLAAKSAGLIDKRGVVDMRALREAHPALFAPVKTPIPPANGGNGRNQSGERATATMNDAIRHAAGRS